MLPPAPPERNPVTLHVYISTVAMYLSIVTSLCLCTENRDHGTSDVYTLTG